MVPQQDHTIVLHRALVDSHDCNLLLIFLVPDERKCRDNWAVIGFPTGDIRHSRQAAGFCLPATSQLWIPHHDPRFEPLFSCSEVLHCVKHVTYECATSSLLLLPKWVIGGSNGWWWLCISSSIIKSSKLHMCDTIFIHCLHNNFLNIKFCCRSFFKFSFLAHLECSSGEPTGWCVVSPSVRP